MVNIKDKKKLEYLKNASRTIRTSSGAWVGSRRIDNGVRGVTETSLYDTNGIDFSQGQCVKLYHFVALLLPVGRWRSMNYDCLNI